MPSRSTSTLSKALRSFFCLSGDVHRSTAGWPSLEHALGAEKPIRIRVPLRQFTRLAASRSCCNCSWFTSRSGTSTSADRILTSTPSVCRSSRFTSNTNSRSTPSSRGCTCKARSRCSSTCRHLDSTTWCFNCRTSSLSPSSSSLRLASSACSRSNASISFRLVSSAWRSCISLSSSDALLAHSDCTSDLSSSRRKRSAESDAAASAHLFASSSCFWRTALSASSHMSLASFIVCSRSKRSTSRRLSVSFAANSCCKRVLSAATSAS
mmetsp:Transcript_3007/g.8688  ORF Transcript_3007/g.8688 Transcript_3007/m.8688 type:complete len:267 (-) Transcript_3007:1140-1940(-)